MFEKQLSPQEIIDKFSQIIKTQRNNDYQSGWAYYQMKNWAEKNRQKIIYLGSQCEKTLAIWMSRVVKGDMDSSELIYCLNEAADLWNEEGPGQSIELFRNKDNNES